MHSLPTLSILTKPFLTLRCSAVKYILSDIQHKLHFPLQVTQPGNRRMCTNASSFCGILDSLYPDSRPMGFPFDRRLSPNDQGENRTENLAQLSNVAMQDIKIVFKNAELTK